MAFNPATQDASVYQALHLGFRVQKSSSLAADDDLFTVTGQVLITMIYGELTTVTDGGASTVLLNEKAGSVPLCAATTITSDAAGHIYMLSGQPEALLNGGGTPVVKVGALTALHDSTVDRSASLTPFIFGLGNGVLADLIIETTETGDDTGVILWTMFYIPLEPGAVVTAA